MSVDTHPAHVEELPPPITAPCALTRLAPEWIGEYVDGVDTGRKMGIKFLCPCRLCRANGVTIAVRFAQPVGGGAPSPDMADRVGNNKGLRWARTGETFETLSLSPSVDASSSGHWHGFIGNGAVT